MLNQVIFKFLIINSHVIKQKINQIFWKGNSNNFKVNYSHFRKI